MREFEVLVVGAGVIGLSVAAALVEEGIGPVMVAEKRRAAGQGSTGRAAGGMRSQFASPINIRMSRYTIGRYRALAASTGLLPGFKSAGYLFLAGSPSAAEYLRQAQVVQRREGVGTQLLSASEALVLAPYVKPEGLLLAAFNPEDVLFDPHEIVTLLEHRCRQAGVEIAYEAPITEISPTSPGFRATTGESEIRAAWVVNAAGPDAARVAGLLDVELPVRPYRRSVAVTEATLQLPNLIPMTIDLDTGVVVRREGPGCAVMYSDPNDLPCEDESFDPGYLDKLGPRVGNRFSFLETVAIDTRKCWSGLYPETPDHHSIVGPAPGLQRFLICAGFGGHGVMHSLAAARAIAETVAHGSSTTFDIGQLRLSRFSEGDLVIEPAVF